MDEWVDGGMDGGGEREGGEERKEKEEREEGEERGTAGRGLLGMSQAGRLKKNSFVAEGVGVNGI